MKKQILLIFALLSLVSLSKAQNPQLPHFTQQNKKFFKDKQQLEFVNGWRDHLPYHSAISVAEAGNRIYCATQYSIFFYDKTDQSINRLSKVNGLSDIGINCIAFNEEYQTLVIAYSNANIDLIKGNTIINIADIKNLEIIGNKSINNIMFVDSIAYLACGFGIVVLDIDKEEFPDPIYYIGTNGSQINVLDITYGSDSLYAATEYGIYKASANNPNLPHYSSWSVDQRIKPNQKFNLIEYFGGKLIVNNQNNGYHTDTAFIYDYNTSTWSKFPGLNNYSKHSVKTQYDKLILVSGETVNIFSNTFEQIIEIAQPGGVNLNSRDAAIDNDDVKWIADYDTALIRIETGIEDEFFSSNGPYSASVFDTALEGENLWVASGGHGDSLGKLYKNDGVYRFKDESWASFNKKTGYSAFDTISDMICVAIDPTNNSLAFVGTWHRGVIEFTDDQITAIYNDQNSSLQKWPAANFIAISGLAFDNNNNLWVANSGAPSMLSVRESNGYWTAFSLGSGAVGMDIGKMMIDSYNQKWVLMKAGDSVLVFSENGTISDPSDDHTKILTNSPGNGNLPGTKIISFAQDQLGDLWLGSNAGIAVIDSPENVFTGGNYDAQRILVEVGGYVHYLLETETVTAIAIDNTNRKWVGTENSGVYLFRADGKEELFHFTEENSPLFSNTIINIKINKTNGEVFIATSNGIISYKNEANSVNPPFSVKDINNVKLFPNPASDDLNFDLPPNMNISFIEILNIQGAIVKSQRISNNQNSVDVSNLPGGMYVIRMQTDKGLLMKKLVKR